MTHESLITDRRLNWWGGVIFGLWVGGLMGILVHAHTTHTMWVDDPTRCLPEHICGECVPLQTEDPE